MLAAPTTQENVARMEHADLTRTADGKFVYNGKVLRHDYPHPPYERLPFLLWVVIEDTGQIVLITDIKPDGNCFRVKLETGFEFAETAERLDLWLGPRYGQAWKAYLQ